jgi:hypothetical protein
MNTTMRSPVAAMRRSARNLSAVALALAVVLMPTASHAAATSVAVAVPAAKGGSGAEVKVPITITGAEGVGAMHVELTFDPAVLQPLSAEKGRLVSTNALVDSNPQPGRLTIGMVSSDKVSGTGEVIVAKFKVLGKKSSKSALGLEKVQAWEGDVNRFDIKVTTTPGEFTVTGKKAFPWLIIVIAAAVVIAGFMYLRSRSGKQSPALATATAGQAPAGAPPPATAEVWFYVDTPVPLVAGDGREVSILQPGTWYRGGRVEGEWMEATDVSGNRGWIKTTDTRRG